MRKVYVTTSGFFRTQALNATLSELGEDRVRADPQDRDCAAQGVGARSPQIQPQ